VSTGGSRRPGAHSPARPVRHCRRLTAARARGARLRGVHPGVPRAVSIANRGTRWGRNERGQCVRTHHRRTLRDASHPCGQSGFMFAVRQRPRNALRHISCAQWRRRFSGGNGQRMSARKHLKNRVRCWPECASVYCELQRSDTGRREWSPPAGLGCMHDARSTGLARQVGTPGTFGRGSLQTSPHGAAIPLRVAQGHRGPTIQEFS